MPKLLVVFNLSILLVRWATPSSNFVVPSNPSNKEVGEFIIKWQFWILHVDEPVGRELYSSMLKGSGTSYILTPF